MAKLNLYISLNFYSPKMICLSETSQLNSLLQQPIPSLIVFTSPQKLIPQESLLAFFYGYQLSKPLHDRIFIYSLVDQAVYQKFQITNFPQVVLIKDKIVRMCFVGYNRQKSIQAISLLSEELGRGRFGKKLNISKSYCMNKHQMELISELNESKYKNGCFYCKSCDMMSHVQTDKPILSCFECNQLHCYQCTHENIRI